MYEFYITYIKNLFIYVLYNHEKLVLQVDWRLQSSLSKIFQRVITYNDIKTVSVN